MSLDVARLLPRFREAAQLQHQQRQILRSEVASAYSEGRRVSLPPRPIPAGGDPRDLRGIPVLGVRGAAGAIRGSQPEQAAMVAFA